MTKPDELERRLLEALCNDGAGKQEREAARRCLADYRWCEPVHQAVFEIIMSFPSTSSQSLREQLPSRLTRRGFPDFDFESLFHQPEFAPDEFERLIRKLGSGV
jgi:SOS response regulatory protein OraA/RecX